MQVILYLDEVCLEIEIHIPIWCIQILKFEYIFYLDGGTFLINRFVDLLYCGASKFQSMDGDKGNFLISIGFWSTMWVVLNNPHSLLVPFFSHTTLLSSYIFVRPIFLLVLNTFKLLWNSPSSIFLKVILSLSIIQKCPLNFEIWDIFFNCSNFRISIW